MVVSLGQRGRASGELDVRRRDLGPALAVVRVAHDLDPLVVTRWAPVEIKFPASHADNDDVSLRRSR